MTPRLLDADGQPWSLVTLKASVLEHVWHEHHAPLTVAVPCLLGASTLLPATAFVDTGAEFSLISQDIADALGDDLDISDEVTRLQTRWGTFTCARCRVLIRFQDQGNDRLDIFCAALLTPPDWPGPSVVLGMRGCLELMRFALQPSTQPDSPSLAFFGAV